MRQMEILKAGCLAYYDTTFSGLIPVKVDSIEERETIFTLVHKSDPHGAKGNQTVKFTITADHGPYRKGEKLESSALWVCPRKSIRRHKYSTTIVPYRVEVCA
jgi:hypothetical protein